MAAVSCDSAAFVWLVLGIGFPLFFFTGLSGSGRTVFPRTGSSQAVAPDFPDPGKATSISIPRATGEENPVRTAGVNAPRARVQA